MGLRAWRRHAEPFKPNPPSLNVFSLRGVFIQGMYWSKCELKCKYHFAGWRYGVCSTIKVNPVHNENLRRININKG